jgi:hypothetical protein
MKLGINIVFGSWKFSFGTITPCCCLDNQRTPRKTAQAKSAPAKASAVATSAPPASEVQADTPARQDAVRALVALGFPKRQAQSRVAVVTAGATTEEIVKAALQNNQRKSD